MPDFVKVKVPASTSNLGSGFDTFGLALNIYLTVEMQLSDALRIEYTGEGADDMVLDETNLVYKTAALLFEKAGQPVPPLSLKIENPIPLSRGLGSSGAAIIAGLVCANTFLVNRFSDRELLKMATSLEGHPENVAASLFGGLTINCVDEEEVVSAKVAIKSPLKLVLLIPALTISTSEARKVLPELVSHKEAVYNVQRSAMLSHVLINNDFKLLREALQDKLHQPFRKQLIPGYDEFESVAYENGALGVCISGSGSTILSFVIEDEERLQTAWLVKAVELNLEGKVQVVQIENLGVKVET